MAFLEQLFYNQMDRPGLTSGDQLNGGFYLCLTTKTHLH